MWRRCFCAATLTLTLNAAPPSLAACYQKILLTPLRPLAEFMLLPRLCFPSLMWGNWQTAAVQITTVREIITIPTRVVTIRQRMADVGLATVINCTYEHLTPDINSADHCHSYGMLGDNIQASRPRLSSYVYIYISGQIDITQNNSSSSGSPFE